MTATELKKQIATLEERVTRLEQMAWPPQPPGRTATRSAVRQPSPLPKPDRPLSEREVVAVLKQMGVVRDRLPEEEALAEEWRRLPEEEKQAHIEYMRSLKLDPPLSQIIIENRR